MDEMGLSSTLGANNENLINYVLTDTFIFLMPVFLFNLFIGIAVGEVSNIVKKGECHLLKVRIDLLLRTFYLISIMKYCRLKCIRNWQHKKYLWLTPKHPPKEFFKRRFYNFPKQVWILRDKLTSMQSNFNFRQRLDGIYDLPDDRK